MYDYVHTVALFMVSLLHLKNELDKNKNNNIVNDLQLQVLHMKLKIEILEAKSVAKFTPYTEVGTSWVTNK